MLHCKICHCQVQDGSGDDETEDVIDLNTKKKSTSICSFYEKGVCKHGRKGENCHYQHPQMCRKAVFGVRC